MRRGAAVPLAALLVAGRAIAVPPPAPAAPGTSTLTVEVTGLKDDRGTLHAALYASDDGFPTQPEKALRQADVPISGGRARVVFEGLGASNDAKGFMGPPSFEKARVEVPAGDQLVVVRVSY